MASKNPTEDYSVKMDNIPCSHHMKSVVCMFCKTCEVLVCDECMSESHKQHEFTSIAKGCQEKMKTLKELEMQISNELSKCEQRAKELENTEIEQEAKYEDMITRIDQNAKEIKDEINRYAQELRDKVDAARKTRIKVISMKKMQIDEALTELKDKQSKVQSAIGAEHGTAFSSKVLNVELTLPEIYLKTLPLDTLDFFPGEKALQKIIDLFGTMKSRKASQNEIPKFDYKVLKSYTTDLSFVDTIIPLDDKTALISNPTSKVIREVYLDKKIKTLKEIAAKIYDMAPTPQNDILLSKFNSSDVNLLTNTGEMKPFLSTFPLITRGIHVIKANDVLVGVKEDGENYKLTKKSSRKIIKFGMDGKQRQSFEFESNKKRLFTLPFSITTNTNGDILVIDRLSTESGRLVVLRSDGILKWSYEGHSLIRKGNRQFNPHDVVTTEAGRVIVADHVTSALHVLSMGGNVIAWTDVTSNNISMPNTFAIDNNGHLWVGCCADRGKSNAKIHIVEFSI